MPLIPFSHADRCEECVRLALRCSELMAAVELVISAGTLAKLDGTEPAVRMAEAVVERARGKPRR